jgi:diadenosine tetraphosphatase ApaH/serine/threonine PP2A family protein phosphatase
MKTLFLLLMTATPAFADLTPALVRVESGGNPMAIGDGGKAYGPLQIRQEVLDDFNRWTGRSVTLRDCFSIRLSREICQAYLAHYATPARLGRPVTDQDRARIWNGGPNGYKKTATLKYWAKVQKHL